LLVVLYFIGIHIHILNYFGGAFLDQSCGFVDQMVLLIIQKGGLVLLLPVSKLFRRVNFEIS
jgi:hypothetical protein